MVLYVPRADLHRRGVGGSFPANFTDDTFSVGGCVGFQPQFFTTQKLALPPSTIWLIDPGLVRAWGDQPSGQDYIDHCHGTQYPHVLLYHRQFDCPGHLSAGHPVDRHLYRDTTLKKKTQYFQAIH